MDVFDAIKTVLAVRQYQDKPVPEDVLRRIVEAGRLTASGQNKQPWHFILVQDKETLQKLGESARTAPYIAQAAAAVVVAIQETRLSQSDASRAIQSMILAAWDAGVGSNWAGFYGLEAVNPLLGIPDGWTVFAIVPLGYPIDPIGKGKKNRKPLAEVASRERFGQSFE